MRLTGEGDGGESYIDGALDHLGPLLGSLRQLGPFEDDEVLLLLLVGQGDHELGRPDCRWSRRRRVAAPGRRPALLAVVRSLGRGGRFVVALIVVVVVVGAVAGQMVMVIAVGGVVVVVVGASLVVRAPVRRGETPEDRKSVV